MHRLAALSFSVALAVIAAAATLPLPPAHAQGDWSVRRDPFDREVVARYKRILARNPADRAALRQLTRLYRRHRSIDLLIREYERELQKDAQDHAAAVVLGHLHLGQGDRDQARAYYERAAKARPDSAAVLVALGDLYQQDGQSAQARGAYERALPGLRGRDARARVTRALAELALAQSDVDAARGFYERYFELAPKDSQARMELADALAQRGRHQDAIAVLQQAAARLRADPAGQVEVLARIGAVHEAAGQENQAVRVYRQAMERVGRGYYLRKELTARIIEIYRRRQALPDLVAEHEKAWPAARRGHFEWDVLARLHEETGDQERAIAAYRMAVKKAPYELDTQRRLIALLENTGREDEALRQYEAVIRVAPGEPRFQLDLAERYWRRGKEREALALVARIARRFPGDGGVHVAIADLYTRWGKADLALQAYTRLTRIEPDEVSHLVNLGEQHFLRNDKKQAVAVWKRIIARKTPESYARLGEVYAEHDMLPEAMKMYERAIRLQPEQPAHYKGRAGVHERRRDFAGAVADWHQVLRLIPRTGANEPARREARRRIVSLLRRGSRSALRKEMAAWQSAFYDTPADVEAGYFLVEAYLREHRYGRARQVLERLLRIDADDVEAMEQLVKVYERELAYDEAVALLERLAELSPGRQRDYYNKIAELKTANREDDEALEYARKALENSPNDPLAHQRLAERYAEMQRFDEAMAAYEKTIALDPRNFDAYFALAQLYKHGHAPDRAAELYREVLRRATDEQTLGRAGREAIDLEEMTRSLGGLERVLAPLAFTFAHRPVYRRILVELYGRYVPELVRAWHGGTAAERAAARTELDRLGAHGLKPLLEALNDETDVRQQRIAVEVLGYLGNQGAAAPLVRLAAQDTKPRPRLATRRSLAPALEWDVRLDALVAAGRLGDPRTIDDLVDLARRDGKDVFREAALFGLGRTGDRRAAPVLVAALDSASDGDVALACLGLAQIMMQSSRHAAGQATGQGPGQRGARPGQGRGPVEALLAAVSDGQRGDVPRAACAFALGYMASPAAVDTLAGALASGNGELQRMAAWALGRVGDRRAEPALVRAYFLRDEPVRRAIRWALRVLPGEPAAPRPAGDDMQGALGSFPRGRDGRYDPAAVVRALPGELDAAGLPPGLLRRLLVSHEAQVIDGLREALGLHRDLLVRVLEDLSQAPAHLSLGELTADLAAAPQVERARIQQALARVGLGILPELAALARHRDVQVRGRTMAVAAKIDSPESQKLLLAGIEDAHPSVRRAAMQAAATHVGLFGRGGEALARAVAGRLRGDGWKGRTHAARVLGVLGELGAHGEVAALARAMTDGNAYVRESAVLSLGRLAAAGVDRDQAVTALARAAGDELALIRVAAVHGLGRAGTPRAREHLRRIAADDPDEQVSGTARRLLQKSKN